MFMLVQMEQIVQIVQMEQMVQMVDACLSSQAFILALITSNSELRH